MNATKHARRMLWGGVALVVVCVVAAVPVRSLLSEAQPDDPVLLNVLNTVQSLRSWLLLCGCAFIAVSLPMRALHGRHLSVRHRPPRAAMIAIIGVAGILIGLCAVPVLTLLTTELMATNTGQDARPLVEPLLIPLVTRVIPSAGAVLLPAAYLQHVIETDTATHERIYTGAAPVRE